MNKTIMCFTDDLNEVLIYEKLGFDCVIDDSCNNIYCCEMNLNNYDMLNILSMCDECLNYNLHPFIILNDVYYTLNNNDDLKIIDKLVSLSPLMI